MKLKNKEIVGMLNILTNFGNKKLPQRISFAITKNISILSKEYTVYEEQMKKLLASYDSEISKDKDGKMIIGENGLPIINNTSADRFKQELEELLAIEVDIDTYLINEDVFDYEDNDGRYDPMSATDIIVLQTILCNDK